MTRDTIKILEAVRKLPHSEWQELKSVLLKECDAREVNASKEKRIYELMKELGIPSNIKGYRYTSKAVLICLEDPKMLDKGITKCIYPTVAKEFSTTAQKVERAIRHATQKVFQNGNIELIQKVFGHGYSTEKGKPTNSEFVAGIVTYIKQNS